MLLLLLLLLLLCLRCCIRSCLCCGRCLRGLRSGGAEEAASRRLPLCLLRLLWCRLLRLLWCRLLGWLLGARRTRAAAACRRLRQSAHVLVEHVLQDCLQGGVTPGTRKRSALGARGNRLLERGPQRRPRQRVLLHSAQGGLLHRAGRP